MEIIVNKGASVIHPINDKIRYSIKRSILAYENKHIDASAMRTIDQHGNRQGLAVKRYSAIYF